MTTPGGQLTPGDEPEIGDPPIYGVPEDAYVGDADSPQSFKDLNTLNKDEAKRRMQAKVDPSFAAQRDGFWGQIQNIIDMMNDRYTGTLQTFIDGQLAHNDRFELLQSISGYGTAYMTLNYWMGSDGGGALGERGREIPFRGYLGPHKNCELELGAEGTTETGHWRLLAPGTWRSEVRVTGESLETDARLIIEVCAPDGSAYSRAIFSKGEMQGTQQRSLAVAHTFVTDAPGYTVYALWTKQPSLAKQKLLGGTELSAFTLSRWDIDTTDHANEPAVPDGPEIG